MSGISKISEQLQGALNKAGSAESKNAGSFSRVFDGERQKINAPKGLKNPARLGVIGKESPTVSHLLLKSREFSRDCWSIVHAPVNRGKDFTRMREGVEVWMDRTTGEIHWGGAKESFEKPALANREQPLADPASEKCCDANKTSNLADAVGNFLGRRYSEMDCYELVVRGLSSLGVKYGGKGGLKQALLGMAQEKGKPANAYLTGEGLVSACGTSRYAKTFSAINDPTAQAQEALAQLSPHLEKGGILSLSTTTRGHTGVVSLNRGGWTYINSGRMDNSFAEGAPKKGVGEERLAAELENWFNLAKSRGEPLSITFGVLAPDKLAAFSGGKKDFLLA